MVTRHEVDGLLTPVAPVGAPGPGWPNGLPLTLVSKCERGPRRLERLPAVTIPVADGNCGGTAVDAMRWTGSPDCSTRWPPTRRWLSQERGRWPP